LELKELINQAQTAYNNNDYAKAISLADSAIQSCKNLLSLEALVFFILTYAMYNYYKRRKLKLRR